LGLYDFNCQYKEYALKNGLDSIFREDSGDHSYYYWDKELKIFMETGRGFK
jgi:S-formylglutathione hydrolase FrmB